MWKPKNIIIFLVFIHIPIIIYSETSKAQFYFNDYNEMAAAWNISEYGFDESGCLFAGSGVSIRDKALNLSVKETKKGKDGKKYIGGCVISKKTYGYGKYTV